MKILNIEINYCNECPYCQWDEKFDAGCFCEHYKSPKGTPMSNCVSKNEYCMTISIDDFENILIPNWCPLPTK